MRRVTGIGGVFFKSSNPSQLQEWYRVHLGIPTIGNGGSVFQWRDRDDQRSEGHTVWGPFPDTTDYFKPSGKDFMFNYRVEDLAALLKQLKEEGVETVGEMEEYDYGKFAWIMDPEGNKIELWEPNDEEFRKVNNLR